MKSQSLNKPKTCFENFASQKHMQVNYCKLREKGFLLSYKGAQLLAKWKTTCCCYINIVHIIVGTMNGTEPSEKVSKVPLSSDTISWRHLKALVFLYAFEESVDCHLLSSFCDDSKLYISLFKYVLSTMGVSKDSISKF